MHRGSYVANLSKHKNKIIIPILFIFVILETIRIVPTKKHVLESNNSTMENRTQDSNYDQRSNREVLSKLISLIPKDLRSTSYHTCPPLLKKLPSRNLPLTALLTFPGSGNSWTRHLLQTATGLMTGSMVKDLWLRTNGYPGEGVNDGTMFVIKSHNTDKASLDKFQRAIVVIRNPVDSVLADFSYKYSRLDHVSAPIHLVMNKQKIEFNSNRLKDWLEWHTIVFNYYDKPILLVYYENLKQNTTQEIKRMLTFMGWSFNKFEEECLNKTMVGPAHRKSHLNAATVFSSEQLRRAEIYKNVVDRMIKFKKLNKFSNISII